MPSSQPSRRSARIAFIVVLTVAMAAVVSWIAMRDVGSAALQPELSARPVESTREIAARAPVVVHSQIPDIVSVSFEHEALIGPELAEQLRRGGPWEQRDLPRLGQALRRVEQHIRDEGPRMADDEGAGLQAFYFELQRAHYQILERVGIGAEVDEAALLRKEAFLREARTMGNDPEARAALKSDMMREQGHTGDSRGSAE